MFSTSSRRAATGLVAVLVLFVLTGCRTYGGYGTEPETIDQIRIANDQFAEEMERARAEYEYLLEQVQQDPGLVAFAESYLAILQLQEQKLLENLDLAESAYDNPDNYRTLSRVYGAIISNQNVVEDRYDALYRVMVEARTQQVLPEEALPPARWQVAPPEYDRMRRVLQQRSVRDILGG